MKNLLNRLYRSHRTSIVGALLFLCGIGLMYAPFPVRFDALQDTLVITFITAGLVGLGLKDSPTPPQNLPSNEKRTDPPAVGSRFPGRSE